MQHKKEATLFGQPLFTNKLDTISVPSTDEFADIVRGGAGLKQRRQGEINILRYQNNFIYLLSEN